MPFLIGLLQLLRGSRQKMALAVAFGLLFAGTGLIPPLLIRRIIQWITEGGGTPRALSSIAALLKDAPILILDEATSSVDTETEHLIQEALSRLTAQRTTVVIAHRLSTIRNADLIVVLDKGCVVEQGPHELLLAHDGYYARMVRAQDLSREWRIGVKPELALTGNGASVPDPARDASPD